MKHCKICDKTLVIGKDGICAECFNDMETRDYAKIYTDGSFKHKRQVQYTFVRLTNRKLPIRHKYFSHTGLTPIVMEYLAIIDGLKVAIEFKLKKVLILSCSELCVDQILEIYYTNSRLLEGLNRRTKDLIDKVPHFRIEWVRKEEIEEYINRWGKCVDFNNICEVNKK